MRRFLRKVKIVKNRYSASRMRRKTLEAHEANLLHAAKLMAHEFPAGTSPHYIAYRLQRSKAVSR